jgi:hypothetical protein
MTTDDRRSRRRAHHGTAAGADLLGDVLDRQVAAQPGRA